MKPYSRYLKIGKRRIKITIVKQGDNVRISSGEVAELKDAILPIVKNGKILVNTSVDSYEKTLKSVEAYITGAINGNKDSSNRTDSTTGRTETDDTEEQTGQPSGEGSTKSVRPSSRRSKQAKSDRGGESDTKVDKEDN